MLAGYRSGSTSPSEVTEAALDLIAERGDDGVWITVADRDAVRRRVEELGAIADPTVGPDLLPLYGIPFAVKDSIDIAGWPTTLACRAWARTASTTAPVVEALLAAGAVLIGKNNLDQFATGLNGTRSPYGIPRSVFGGELISGGSSSGSAVAVALGEVPLAVATDTAGSGRVPPALNGIPGLKPTRGLISATGLVPACRSLDCVSLIAASMTDLGTAFDVVAKVDPNYPWTRSRRRVDVRLDDVRVGLPDAAGLEFFGDDAMRDAHLAARSVIGSALPVVAADLEPFLAAGGLLYGGPWVAERWVEFGDFLDGHPGAAHPVVEQIIRSGAGYTAADVFSAQYRLTELKLAADRVFDEADVLVVPAVGTTFTVDQVLADPIGTNTALGHYTHFANLLDLCAATVPTGVTADGRPAAAMVLGPALADDLVLAVARAIEAAVAPAG